MAAQLEAILSRLLVPDNNVIQQATLELKEVTKDPAIIPALCTILGSSQNPQVRQYAALLLRRRIMRKQQWRGVPADIQLGIKQSILPLLLQESEKTVRKAIAQIVGTVAKHELPKATSWPEFFDFIQQNIRSEDPQRRELGMFVMSVASSVASQQLQPHLKDILVLCGAALDDTTHHMVPFLAIRTLVFMVAYIGTEEAKAFKALIPKIVIMIKNLIKVDEELAVEAMEIFDELVECEVNVVVPFLQDLIHSCLEIASNTDLGDAVRIKGLSFISWLVRLKRKSILKLKLDAQIVAALFPIMSEPSEEEEDDAEFEEAEANTASAFAAQVLDTMALHLPPEKVMPPVMKLVEQGLQSQDPNHRRASLLALAVTAEGCSDYIMHKSMKTMLTIVCNSISDPVLQVQNAALFALGQFSEYFQPDISKHSAELLPLLFDHMTKASANVDKDPKGLTKSYYALEMFCENLGKDILPYLPTLMQHLLSALSTATTPHAKELSISAIGATANAAGEEIVPYFTQIMEQLQGFLSPALTEDQLKVQMQSLDTLGVLARTMGPHFQPLAAECLVMSLRLLREATDPDLKRCVYSLLGALSVLLKEQMQPHLEEIVKEMIGSIKSVEGITAHSDDTAGDMFKIFDEESVDDAAEEDLENMADDEDEDDDDEEGHKEFSISNAYLTEKEDACTALGELATTTGVAFLPFMEESYSEVTSLIEHPSPDVRKATVSAIGQFCCAMFELAKLPDSQQVQAACETMLQTSVPQLMKVIKEDADRQVVMMSMETLAEMLKKIGTPVLQVANVDNFMNVIKDVLHLKIACQDTEEESDPELDDPQAEYDAMLVEGAGDLIPAVAKVVGGEAFAPYLAGLLPDLLRKLKSSSPVADRSFAVGTLAEALDAIGPAAAAFAEHLYKVFTDITKDEDEEVRSNAIYGLGILAKNSGAVMFPKYPEILKLLISTLNKEKDRRVIDNVCAAFCRLIWTNIDAVPMDQVMPLVVQCLPLGEDHEENETVYPCIADLYKNGHTAVVNQVSALLVAFSQVLGSGPDKLKPDTELLLVQLVQNMAQQFPEEFQKATTAISQEQSTKLHACLSACNGS